MKRIITATAAAATPLLIIALFIAPSLCREDETIILSCEEDFTNFANDVNAGTDYFGTTVFLGDDLNFSNSDSHYFSPIGNNDKEFRGTFDGQGHTISGLAIGSTSSFSSEYAGLFGYSSGAFIKNIVLGDSCTVSYDHDFNEYAYAGGIIGFCGGNSECEILNSVNMAEISFTGNSTLNYFLGGIVGRLNSDRYESTVKNCVNYGDLLHSGSCGSYSGIGGIVGYSRFLHVMNYIQNCLNYGAIVNTDESCYPFIGGIVGINSYAIENCVNAGKIDSSYEKFVGGIAGDDLLSDIRYCYWDNSVANPMSKSSMLSRRVVRSYSFNSTTFELSATTTVNNYTGKHLISALNAFADSYYFYNNLSHWALNEGAKQIEFTVNGKSTVVLNSRVILLPDIANDGKLWFDGWYTDKDCTVPLNDFTLKNIILYGKWAENTKNYTITFNTRGGSQIAPIEAQYLSIVKLPRSTRADGCEVAYWENDYDEIAGWNFAMPSHDVTLHAVWLCTSIKSPGDLIAFSKVVNSAAGGQPGTVLLDSDIDFTEELSRKFETIGKNGEGYFTGTFDGQGYTIRNLAINSSSQFIGLFGYFNGESIRNVILDSSCSISNSQDSGQHYVGGLAGFTEINNELMVIENSINMARISFKNDPNNVVYLGGIVGQIYSPNSKTFVRNCANYGSITCTSNNGIVNIGGITGISEGSKSHVHIGNCLNYGAIASYGAKKIVLGGISGITFCTIIENCVSVETPEISRDADGILGSLVGSLETSTVVWCYWDGTRHGAYQDAVGKSIGSIESNVVSFDSNFELNESVFIGSYEKTSLLEALNTLSDPSTGREEYSRWALNRGEKNITFMLSDRKSPLVTETLQVILLPNLAECDWMGFKGWFVDQGCTKALSTFEIVDDEILYGRYYEKSDSTSPLNIITIVGISLVVIVFVVITVSIIIVAIHKRRAKRLSRAILRESLLYQD